MIAAAAFVAQQVVPGVEGLAEYGVLGALVVALGTLAWRDRSADKARIDTLEAEVRELNREIIGTMNRVLPLVERCIAALETRDREATRQDRS